MASFNLEKATSPKFGIQYLYVLLMISFTFQISYSIPLLGKNYIFWLVGFGFAIYYSAKYLTRQVSLCAIFYLFVMWVNFFMGDSYFGGFRKCMNETVALIVPITMLYYLITRNDKRLFHWILIVFSLFLIESTIVSFMADAAFPNIMRLQSNAESAEENAFILDSFRRLGLASYSLPHAIPIIIPALVYMAKKTAKMHRWLAIVLLLAIMVMIYISGSFTALFLGAIVLVFSIIVNSQNVGTIKKTLVILLILLSPLLFSQNLQVSILEYLQNIFPDDSLVTKKLVDIENTLIYGESEGLVEGRSDLYRMTFNAILSNPLWGTSGEIGEHMALFDRWATLGLIGFIPLLFFIYYQAKYALTFISDEKRFYYFMGLLVFIVMISMKGSFSWELWFCFIVMLPGLLWWTDSIVNHK